MAAWKDWEGWRRECALDRCGAEAQNALCDFARLRWRYYAAVCLEISTREVPCGMIPAPREAWLEFEAKIQLQKVRAGKAYKKWLFARVPRNAGAGALDVVQGGASLILRDVVRDRFRHEMPRRGTVSLDAPWPGSAPDAPAVFELLPSVSDDNPASAVQQRDLEGLGAKIAETLCRRILKLREKVALLARDMGLSLSHPQVLAAAGCEKTRLCTAYHEALRRVAETVDARFATEDRSTRAGLAVAAFHALKVELAAWDRADHVLGDVPRPRRDAMAVEAGRWKGRAVHE